MVKKLALLLTLITVVGCSGEKNQSTLPKKENVKIVKSIELKEQSVSNIKNYNGELKPKEEMKVVTLTGGDIEEIYYKNGDSVKKDEVIAKISNADVEASYYEAEGKLLKAKSTYETEKISYEKYKKLYEKEIISENDYLAVKNRYELAQGELKIAEGNFIRAKDSFDRLKIVSKIDGIITDLYVKRYEKVENGKDIVTVIDNSKMEIDVAVSGNDIKNIKVGDKANLYIEEIGEKREGEVSEINLSSDSNSKKYSLRVVVGNSDGKILKGMYAKLTLNHGKVDGIFVPTKAIMIKELYSYVAIIRDEKAIIYRVNPIMTLGDLQLIEFPEYKLGDRIVVEGQYLLNNNDKVKEN